MICNLILYSASFFLNQEHVLLAGLKNVSWWVRQCSSPDNTDTVTITDGISDRRMEAARDTQSYGLKLCA